ncbi:uncharacterized protein LAJ45_08486 [Morchella importuna]|uniref:uncharacterized protein n=1 Tax=Morchella importuna TaxID=1174673 RepID=UPI001E8D245E|nr:uncharacterized protein LAJ45_08486 [Morchella importuna]KAH8147330.1 hypothetical protein LAJ45_08486 [Morchella importuna]
MHYLLEESKDFICLLLVANSDLHPWLGIPTSTLVSFSSTLDRRCTPKGKKESSDTTVYTLSSYRHIGPLFPTDINRIAWGDSRIVELDLTSDYV